MTDLPFTLPDPDPTRPERPPAKCRRHDWEWTEWAGDQSRVLEMVEWCRRCHKRKADAATVSRVRRASARGFRTSADLAAYLGGQSVDKLGWPWDVQGKGYRIQSKRLATRPGPREMFRLLDAIPTDAETLASVYYVPPRRRLAAGVVLSILSEWLEWHAIPDDARVVTGGPMTLLEMPLPTFRDVHIGEKAA